MTTSTVPSHLTAFFAEFERQGEVAVRFAVEAGEYNLDLPRLGAAKAWISLKESERSNSSAAKRDAREEETLSIARAAISNSRRANHIAIAAAILAAVATIIAAIIGVIYASSK
jgi:hypothetical protein